MALPKIPRRTLILAVLAAVATGLTLYDYSVGLPDRGLGSRQETHNSPSMALGIQRTGPQRSGVGQTIAELEKILSNAEVIRQRYRTVAVPYAESVAGFATLYAPGEAPRDKAVSAIRGLIPAEIEVKELLISTASPTNGSLWLTASLSLTGSDSRAMIAAILALGDASNGMVWKELVVGVDEERRLISAKGRISLLMAQLAE